MLLCRAVDAPLKILAVDNEPNITLSLRYVFAGPRYEVMTVDSGAAALALVEANPNCYDIMIVDQKMPNLTGLELVQAVRSRGFSGKVVVVSAHLSSEIRESYQRLDVHAMFPKPFDIAQLRSAVDCIAA
ncbi:MAG: two-component system, response regulator, stage 0 sporulation protein [Verrucomicrobiota bacterium]